MKLSLLGFVLVCLVIGLIFIVGGLVLINVSCLGFPFGIFYSHSFRMYPKWEL